MDSSNSEAFYSDLPLLESFFDITSAKHFHCLPDDWYIAITDVVNSTDAIQDGQYKKVNILGASPIVGVLNSANKKEIPFTFGGDGCLLCIPPSLLGITRTVFGSSRLIGKNMYGLDLRAAIIPMNQIRESGNNLKVARYKVSDTYNQAIFSGSGIEYAEKVLKDTERDKFQVPVARKIREADFSGLECRWQEVDQPGKKVITLIARCNPKVGQPDAVYQGVLKKMREIFGFDHKTNPVVSSELRMNISFPSLVGEYQFRTFGMNWWQRIKYFLRLELEIVLGKIFMATGLQTTATDWSLYKPDVVSNSDHRKFDNMLRLVLSGTEDQLQELKHFLEEEYNASRLAYGIHVSNSATITCMVFKYHRQHIHFVDGTNGGYSMAYLDLKERSKSFSS